MNTARLKAFAPGVRRDLMEAVDRKLGVVLAAKSPDLRATYAPQVAALAELARVDRAGLVERVAYTWFNRFTALRYLDARGWHPFRARVLTSAGEKATQPELLKVVREGALPPELARHTDPARLNDLLDGRLPSTDPQGEVYRHLVLASCRFYHSLLPDLFERLDDATELLLPDDLLTEHSVAAGFRTEIRDDDCADVEVLGWLYQFYIAEKKSTVMARKAAVPTEDIPAVTQLFTPHWIVRYLVENSLGRLWLLNRPGSRLREHMPYFIEGEAETDFLKLTRPEDIRLCDPAVGSGHMLTYAFDLLTLIYEEEGYAPTEIPALILRHNLYGLEICPRAAQLAELALVFKARERSPRFFQQELLVRPRIIELREVRFTELELREYSRALDLGVLFNAPLIELLHQFEEAKNVGSLIQPCLDERAIADIRLEIEAKDIGGQLFLTETHLKVLRVLDQAEALTQRYHVVVANPPYMGSGQMNAPLKQFTRTFFPESKQDLMTCFMSRASTASLKNGLCGMINLPAWLFITSFEAFRKKLVCEQTILSFLHLGRGIFGSDFGSVAFVLGNRQPAGYVGTYRRLFIRHVEVESIEEKERRFLDRTNGRFHVDQRDFKAIDGTPIAYWISSKVRKAFAEGVPFRNIGNPRVGMQTSNNDRFLRLWYEVNAAEFSDEKAGRRKWIKYLKGGPFRKWYGNLEYLLHYNESPEHILQQTNATILPLTRLAEPKCTWTDVTSGAFSCRWAPADSFHDISGHCFYPSKEDQYYLLALANTKQFDFFLGLVKSSMHCQVGDVGKMPLLAVDKAHAGAIGSEAVSIARADWDNFETSWDFSEHPLLRLEPKGAALEARWRNWEEQSTAAIRRMQELETENNRLFITAYGLDGELQPEVPEEQITLARADARRDMAAFLSYAVGCIVGRYSPDRPGLILANAGDTIREFLERVGKPLAELTFAPDEDGIIPVLDGEWFEDDIVARTRDFLRATFGDATLRENLRFIEDSLGKDLRKYFLTDFYKDHLQTYKKRPIYWLLQSPKKGFSVLVYLHRYTRDTLNVVLNRYLREYQDKLRNRLTHLSQVLADEAFPARDRTTARKEAERLTKTLHECQEWERESLLPLAQQRIPLDLDDGVKVNYLKLADVLAPIPGLAAAEE